MRATCSHYFPPNTMALYCPFADQRASETLPNTQLCCPNNMREWMSFICLGPNPLPPLDSSKLVSMAETVQASWQILLFLLKDKFYRLNLWPQFHGNLWDQKMPTTKIVGLYMAAAVNDIQNLLILCIGTYSSHPPLSGQRGYTGTGSAGAQGLASIIRIPCLYPSFAEESPACKRQDSNDNSLITLVWLFHWVIRNLWIQER